MKPENVIKEQHEGLYDQLKQIKLNFDAKKSLFNNLQKASAAELEKLYNSGDLKNVKEKWQKELEVNFEPTDEEQHAQLVAFN